MKKYKFLKGIILEVIIAVVIATPFCIGITMSKSKENIEFQKIPETVFRIEDMEINDLKIIKKVSGIDEKSGVKYNNIPVFNVRFFKEGDYKYTAKILNDTIYLLSPIEEEEKDTILKVVEVANVNREIFYTFKDVENNIIIPSISKNNIVNIEKLTNNGEEYIAKLDNVLKKVTIVSVKEQKGKSY